LLLRFVMWVRAVLGDEAMDGVTSFACTQCMKWGNICVLKMACCMPLETSEGGPKTA